MIERARLIARQGRPQDALGDLSKVIKRCPDHARAWVARASVLVDTGNYEAALRDVNRSIEISPARARHHVLRGDLRLLGNQITAAIDDYSQAISLDPADHLAFRKRGSCYQNLRQHLYAIADLTRSDELFPGQADTLVLRGQSYLKNDQLDQASEDFLKALRLNPDHVRAYVGRATVLAQKGRHEESLILLTRAMHRFRKNARQIAELLMMRGKVFYQMGRFPPALTDFTSVIRLRREDPFNVAAARCARAVVLVQHGELVRAKKEFDRVLEKFPGHPLAGPAADWLAKGTGPRPEILMPPEQLIPPTRPPVVGEPVEVGTTDPRWDAEAPFDLWLVRTARPREYGPLPKSLLDDWVRQGRITGDMRLLRSGWSKWRKASRIYEMLPSASGSRRPRRGSR
jgi:tetratricopeptide (TPR) repeat protein